MGHLIMRFRVRPCRPLHFQFQFQLPLPFSMRFTELQWRNSKRMTHVPSPIIALTACLQPLLEMQAAQGKVVFQGNASVQRVQVWENQNKAVPKWSELMYGTTFGETSKLKHGCRFGDAWLYVSLTFDLAVPPNRTLHHYAWCCEVAICLYNWRSWWRPVHDKLSNAW